MTYSGVRFLMTEGDRQVVTNIFHLQDGRVVNTVKMQTFWNEELKKILREGFQGEDGRVVPADGRAFLAALKFRYTGSYFRATDVVEVDDLELRAEVE